LLESKRAPFDHSETEAEVVAGYAVNIVDQCYLFFT
jgi:NADH:ubiquinone oxidoreductase subunit H